MNVKDSLFNSKFISRLLPTVLVAIATAGSISGISSNKPSSIEPLVSLDERPKILEEEIKPEEKQEQKEEDGNSDSSDDQSSDSVTPPTPPAAPEDNSQESDAAKPKQTEEKNKEEKKDDASESEGKSGKSLSGDQNNSEPTKEDVINRLKQEIKQLTVNKEDWNNNRDGLLTNFKMITSLTDIAALIQQYQEIEKKANGSSNPAGGA